MISHVYIGSEYFVIKPNLNMNELREMNIVIKPSLVPLKTNELRQDMNTIYVVSKGKRIGFITKYSPAMVNLPLEYYNFVMSLILY